MDLGAMVCLAKNPKCNECPMKAQCAYVRKKIPAPPLRVRGGRGSYDRNVLQIAAGIIHRNGNILIARRPDGKHLSGLWEFPGGKRGDGESWRDCVKREIKEELGIEVAVRPHDWHADYQYPDRTVHIRFHRCSILKGKPTPREGQEIKWILPRELTDYKFPPANTEVLAALTIARFL